MKNLSNSHLRYLAIVGFLILFVVCPLPVAGLKVVGASYVGTVTPGDTVIHTMTVSTQAGDVPMDLMVDAWGFGQSPDGSLTSLSPQDDTSPYSARSYITLSPTSFHLNPGESKVINASIVVPKNVGDGGRYAVITIHNAPIGSGSTGFVTAISVPVLVTIASSKMTRTGTIVSVTAGDIIPGQPIRITTALKNTGNIHCSNSKNIVRITDSAGKEVAAVSTDPLMYSIIPTNTVNYDVSLDKALPPGTYTVSSKVSLEDGTILDTKTTSFEVPEHYVPAATVSSAQTTGVVKTQAQQTQSQQTGVSPARTTYSGVDVIMVVAALGLCVVVIGKKWLK